MAEQQRDKAPASACLQRHFPPKFWAKRWGVDPTTVVRWFRDEPGVLRVGNPAKNGKRTRTELRIPFSVAARVYGKRTGKVL
jgi:predicted site-specific integrase-resolvase